MSGRIRNVVFSAPDGDWVDDHWEGGQRALAQFYADLLGWQVIREDWPVVARNGDALPRLAFGEGPTPVYRPPELGDPERPQQLHVDLPSPDLDAADNLALKLGATKLRHHDDHRTYADPVGHPFCIYRADDDRGIAGFAPGRVGRVVIDCFSPRALAQFYSELLGLHDRVEDTPERVILDGAGDGMPDLGFQHSVHVAPRWPDPAYPQQIHLDLHFDDVEAGSRAAEGLGAMPLREMGGSCAVFADPAAHPFCLCGPGQ